MAVSRKAVPGREILTQHFNLEVSVGLPLLLSAVLVGSLSSLVAPIGRDQGLWLLAAGAIQRGLLFYRDFLHFHLPGTAYAYTLTGDPLANPHLSIYLLAVANTALIAVTSFLLVRAVQGRAAAWISAVLFVLFFPAATDWWGVNQKDILGYPFFVCALLLIRRGLSHGRLSSFFGAGAAASAALLFKPIYGLPLLAIAVVLAAIRPSRHDPGRASSRARAHAAFWLGAATIVTPFVAQLALRGGLRDAAEALLIVGPRYLQSHRVSFGELSALLAKRLENGLSTPLIVLGLVGLLMVIFRSPRRQSWLLFLPLFGAVSFFAQGKGFTYHAAPLVASWLFLCGAPLAWLLRLWRRDAPSPALRKLTVLLVFGGLLAHVVDELPSRPHYRLYWPVLFGATDRDEMLREHFPFDSDFPNPVVSKQLSRWISANSEPHDRILVWGFECQIYLLSQRNFVGHAPFDQILTLAPDDSRAQAWLDRQRTRFMSALAEAPPRYFVVTRWDANPVESIPSSQSLHRIEGLAEFLETHYRLEREFGRFQVFRLTPDALRES